MPIARPRAGVVGPLLLFPLVFVVVAAVGALPPAAARSKLSVEQIVAQGEARLASGDLPGAAKLAESAFRIDPRAESLLLLGKVALRGGQALVGRDLLLRVLADPDTTALYSEAQRLLEGSPPVEGGSAEVAVIGPRGALVFVDSQLRGVLPLLSPVLMAPGARTIELELGKRRLAGKLQVELDRHSEARFDFGSGSVVVSWPPLVVLLYAQPPSTSSRVAALLVERALRREGLALLDRETALRRHPAAAGCLGERRCQIALTTRNEAEALLTVDLSVPPVGAPGPARVALSWLDPTVGELAAEAAMSCESCSAERLAAEVEAAVKRLLTSGRARPNGALELSTAPAEAAVVLDGKPLTGPSSRLPLFAGQHELAVRAPGHLPQLVTITIEPGKTLQQRIALVPEPKAPAPVPLPPPVVAPPPAAPVLVPRLRSRGALIAGVVAIGAGALLGGLGASGLAVAGQCAPGPSGPPSELAACRQFYDSQRPGTAMLSVGVGVMVGGIVAAAVGGRTVLVRADAR